ncbi:MAG TPA: twin-arginine translocation signal domain-containing protein [Acidobacteriaceae bacterium]|nr:twin-arginine translocation signal domain-containing protein [Acidobacteriaceae bacterium]
MTTRRNFLKLAAASGVVAAAAPLMALSRLDIGVGTYSYHSVPVDDMIVQLNLLRIRKIEMSRGESCC